MQDVGMRGTKKLIFDTAVNLFSQKSYESVTIEEIADCLGRRKSGIYNHFESKYAILEAAYDFFCQNFMRNRLSLEEFDPIIQNGTVMDMLRSIHYEFTYERENLQRIYGIIYHRRFSDERAKSITTELLIASGIRYVEDVFDRAIKAGRLAPFDTHALSLFCNNNWMAFYFYWSIDPTEANLVRLHNDIERLNSHAASLIVDLKPPAGTP